MMFRTFLACLIIIPSLLFGQVSSNQEVISSDSIAKKLASAYKGAAFKNPDSALALINTSFLKFDRDPLVKAWKNHLRGNYFYGKQNVDSSLFYFDKVFETIVAKDDPYLFNETKILSGMVYNNSGRPEDALIKFKEAEEELLKNPNTKPQLKANLFRATGIYYLNSGKHEASMDYFLKALEIIESDTSLANVLDRVLINLAEVSAVIGDNQKTKKYLLQSKKAAENNNNEYGIHKANIKLAEVALKTNTTENYELKGLERAITFFDNAGQIINVIEGNLYHGRILKEHGQLELSEQSFLNALVVSKKIGMPQGIINSSMNLGKVKTLQKQYTSAIEYYNSVKEIAFNYANKQTNIQLHDNLANAYAAQKDFDAAYRNLLKSKNLSDSLDIVARFELTKDLETKYQTEKKEQEISLLKAENQLAEQKSTNQRNLIAGGLGITTIAGLFLYVLFRNRKKTTDKLKQLDSLKSKFFTNISHEFRTPLTLITNPIEEMLEDESISDKKRQKFSMAKRNSDRLLSLVNQLQDLSKSDAGKLKLQIQKGNLKQLISALSDSFSYQAKQKHINYTVKITHEDLHTYFDKDAIEKIVVNLISNAIKYTPENGAVSFYSETTNGIATLEVKNKGVGLTKEEIDNIFERFYQTSEDNIGTGIGLALVKEIVDLHKGEIEVDSAPDGWTTFKVRLPIDKNSFKKEHFTNTNTSILSVENDASLNQLIEKFEEDHADNNLPVLLIVEDNADVRTLIKQTFESNYSIITASNGKEGIDLAIENIPDIIISDIMMPIKNGIELAKELKNDQRTSHIPIVLLTAKVGEENELIGIETGADDYITKPFNSKILVAKISKLLELRTKLQERYSHEIILKPKAIAMNNIDEEFLEKVQIILDEKIVESSFNIEAFCQGIGMSRMQLHRKIKALTGLSTSEFIRSQRLKLAAELLKKTDVNIAEIGYAVGFNDRSYFTKCFRETFGSAPTAYAKKFVR